MVVHSREKRTGNGTEQRHRVMARLLLVQCCHSIQWIDAEAQCGPAAPPPSPAISSTDNLLFPCSDVTIICEYQNDKGVGPSKPD